MRKLGKVKYTGTDGKKCEVNVLEEMSVMWKRVGDELDMSPAKLEGIEKMHLQNNEDCMRDVAREWMQKSPDEVTTSTCY